MSLALTCDRKGSSVELHLSGSTGMASHSDVPKVRIIGFFFENRLYLQLKIRLLLFTVCIWV